MCVLTLTNGKRPGYCVRTPTLLMAFDPAQASCMCWNALWNQWVARLHDFLIFRTCPGELDLEFNSVLLHLHRASGSRSAESVALPYHPFSFDAPWRVVTLIRRCSCNLLGYFCNCFCSWGLLTVKIPSAGDGFTSYSKLNSLHNSLLVFVIFSTRKVTCNICTLHSLYS